MKKNIGNKNSSNVYGIIGGAIATVVGISIAKKIIDRKPSVDDLDQNESDEVHSSAVNEVDDRTEAYRIASEVKAIISKVNAIANDISVKPVIRVPLRNLCILLRELDTMFDIIDNRLTEQVFPVVTPEIQAEFNRLVSKSRTIFDDIQFAKLIMAADSVSDKIQNMPDDRLIEIAHFNEQLGKLMETVLRLDTSDSAEDVNEALTSFDNLSKEVDSYISNNEEKAHE